jgi:class 3 adenylate cyclase
VPQSGLELITLVDFLNFSRYFSMPSDKYAMEDTDIEKVLGFLGGSSSPDRQEFLEMILEICPEASVAAVWLKDRENEHYLLDRIAEKNNALRGMPESIQGRYVECVSDSNGNIIVVPEEYFKNQIHDWLQKNSYGESIKVFPISIERGSGTSQETLGILSIHSTNTIDEICNSIVQKALIGALARNIDTSRESKRLRTISRVRKMIEIPNNLVGGKIHKKSLDIAREIIGFELGMYVVKNREGRWVIREVSHLEIENRNITRVVGFRLKKKSLVECVADERKEIWRLTSDTHKEDDDYEFDSKLHSLLGDLNLVDRNEADCTWMAVPVHQSGAPIDSVLVLVNKNKPFCKFFSETDAECMKSIAEILATAVPFAEYSSSVDRLFSLSFPDTDNIVPYLEKVVEVIPGVKDASLLVQDENGTKVIDFDTSSPEVSGEVDLSENFYEEIRDLELVGRWRGLITALVDHTKVSVATFNILKVVSDQIEEALNMGLPRMDRFNIFREGSLGIADLNAITRISSIGITKDSKLKSELVKELKKLEYSAVVIIMGDGKWFSFSVDPEIYSASSLYNSIENSFGSQYGNITRCESYDIGGTTGAITYCPLEQSNGATTSDLCGFLFEDDSAQGKKQISRISMLTGDDIPHFIKRFSEVFILRESLFSFLPFGISQKCWESKGRVVPLWNMSKKAIPTVSLSYDLRQSTMVMLNSTSKRKYERWLRKLIAEIQNVVLSSGGIFGQFTGDGVLVHFIDEYCVELQRVRGVECAFNCAEKMLKITKKYLPKLDKILQFRIEGVGAGIAIDLGKGHWNFDSQNSPIVTGKGVVGACRLCDKAPSGRIRMSNGAYESWKRHRTVRMPKFRLVPVKTKEIKSSMGFKVWEH